MPKKSKQLSFVSDVLTRQDISPHVFVTVFWSDPESPKANSRNRRRAGVTAEPDRRRAAQSRAFGSAGSGSDCLRRKINH